jgi:hypothetical protein
VEGVLGKVMGRAQASNMIQRTIDEANIPDPYRLSTTEVRKLAVKVIEQVPNTSKRRQLLVELDASMEHLKI